MVVDELELLSFLEWLLPGGDGSEMKIGALGVFLLIVPALSATVAFVCYLFSVARHGPSEGFYTVARTVAAGVTDISHISPRRVWAMARLAINEAVRRRVLIVVAIFMLVLLFAGWFLDSGSEHPARLYISFVLTMTTYLALALGLLLSTFSLPNDIKNKTIHTILTKPVRQVEIVLGRILGFVAVGTAMLVVMGFGSYLFVRRGLSHTHTVESVERVEGVAGGQEENPVVWRGTLTSEDRHTHTFEVHQNGEGQTDIQRGHWHQVRVVKQSGKDGKPVFSIGPPQGWLQARVPIYGGLMFLDRNGQSAQQGINVGKEWDYRGYIEGGSQAAAIWTFSGITEQAFPEQLSLELNLRVFRSFKGEIERGVLGSIYLSNPDSGAAMRSVPVSFEAKEFSIDEIVFGRSLDVIERDGIPREGDIFKDLVSKDGALNVIVQCSERAQYFGMAQGDVYVRSADAPFFINFFKGYIGIWLQMVTVTAFGVMFSTFLNAAVAMLTTFSCVILGFRSEFVSDIRTGDLEGGGPIEATVRLLTQMNLSGEFSDQLVTKVVQFVDQGLLLLMSFTANILPNYNAFDTTDYVAYGFDIYGGLLSRNLTIGLVYTLAAALVGYFFLKTREVAA